MEHAVEAGATWLEHSSKNCARRVCWRVSHLYRVTVICRHNGQHSQHFTSACSLLLTINQITILEPLLHRWKQKAWNIGVSIAMPDSWRKSCQNSPAFYQSPRHCEAKSMYWSLPVASHSFSFNASVGFWILAAGAVVAGGWSARVDSGWQWCVEISCVDIHENYWNLVFWSSLHMFTQ